ncbi:membrane protein insertase YidC [Hydrogenobaculum acidophilum]
MEQVDLKRLIVVFFAVSITIVAYQYISEYFFKSPKPTQINKTSNVEAKEKPTNITYNYQGGINLLLNGQRGSLNVNNGVLLHLKDADVKFSYSGGRIVYYYIKNFKQNLITPQEYALKIFPLEIYTGDSSLDQAINFDNYNISVDKDDVRMTLSLPNIKVEKDVHFDKEGFISYINISLSGYDKPYFVMIGNNLNEEDLHTHQGPVFNINGNVKRLDNDDIKTYKVITGNISFAGEESRFFFQGIKGHINSIQIYKERLGKEDFTLMLASFDGKALMFFGPKEYDWLKKAGLTDVLDFGDFRIVVEPLFKFLYFIYIKTGNWIISIFVLTLIIRILFFPLNYKSTLSMSKLSEVAPKMEKIKEKYKDDPVKMQEEIMKLYKEVGFNPASGCLPILVQIPIFFSLYKVIVITADLKLAHFLWIHDLTQKDPYYILPILMGITMIMSLRLTPNPDPRQNSVMYISSIFFVFLFASFPAALVIYWTINNILSFLQTYLIRKVLLKDKLSAPTKSPKTK